MSAQLIGCIVRAPLAVGLTLTVALAGCGQSKTSGTTFLSINTATISKSRFQPSIKAVSPLESTTNVALSPEADGRVIKKLVSEGDQVKAGQVILVLDNTQLSAQLDAARSQARYDRVNAERYQFLYEQGAASAKRRDAYATKAIQSRDQAIADKANLNYKFVRSPIDGVVGDLDAVKIGDYVKTGDIITGIVDNSTLWTLMEIPASQGSQVKVGQPVRLASQSTPQITGEGTITFVSPYYAIPKASNPPNTLMVKAVFPNSKALPTLKISQSNKDRQTFLRKPEKVTRTRPATRSACRRQIKDAFQMANFDNGVSNSKLNWWQQNGSFR